MSNTDNNNEFSQYYDQDSFWEKVKKKPENQRVMKY